MSFFNDLNFLHKYIYLFHIEPKQEQVFYVANYIKKQTKPTTDKLDSSEC